MYGDLKRFGNTFDLVDVKNTSEVLRALFCQIKGFRMAIQKGKFEVKLKNKYFTHETLKDDVCIPFSDGDTLHITPIISGSGGAIQFVVGAVLAVVGYAMGWTGIGAVVGTIGVGLMASGVASMLTATPNMPQIKNEDENNVQSTSFSNLQNLVAQGRPVPLAYGRMLVGSLIIGKGVETHTVEAVAQNTSNDKLNGAEVTNEQEAQWGLGGDSNIPAWGEA